MKSWAAGTALPRRNSEASSRSIANSPSRAQESGEGWTQRPGARVVNALAYQISVRLENGSYQTIQQDSLVDLQVGNRVRIENGRVYRN